MARGWESKSVEAQQAEAAESKSLNKPLLTAEQRRNLQKREGLLLERKRVLQQIEDTSNQRYRAMLQSALADLDRKIAEMG